MLKTKHSFFGYYSDLRSQPQKCFTATALSAVVTIKLENTFFGDYVRNEEFNPYKYGMIVIIVVHLLQKN